ncbi:MAG: S1C family serine protease [Caldisericaceae bacterium]
MEENKVVREKRSWVVFLIVGLIIGGIVGGMFGTFIIFKNPSLFPWASLNTIQTSSQGTINVNPDIVPVETAVEKVADTISPEVVQIVSTTQVINPFFMQSSQQQGLGSGVIIRSDGLILTNNHVIADANKIEVTLTSGKTYSGTVLGTDPVSDVALVKINATNLPYATLGDSSKIKVGEFVVAIGNPYGLDHTVTFGVISAVERNIDNGDGTTMYGVIQTDTAINPGNSGGPLVDLQGNVIGINTMIYNNSQGLGFAVSSNTCEKVINDILAKGKVQWPFLGVGVTTMSESLAQQQNIKYVEGVLVSSVQAGSAASKAGIKVNDIITAIDGKAVTTSDQLISIIRGHNVGDKITLTILRANSNNPIQVTAVLGSQS